MFFEPEASFRLLPPGLIDGLARDVPGATLVELSRDRLEEILAANGYFGEPESTFKLVILEISRPEGSDRRFVWDAAGDLHTVGGDVPTDPEVVVALNETSPTLGLLDPPHQPGDRRPRLEVAFGVNAERWLVATVVDLFTHRTLLRAEPVVRLLRPAPPSAASGPRRCWLAASASIAPS